MAQDRRRIQIVLNLDLRAGLAVAAGLLALCVVVPLALRASPVDVPNTFANGEVADAVAVNANFAAIESAVDDNDQRLTGVEGQLDGILPMGGTHLRTAVVGTVYSSAGDSTPEVYQLTTTGPFACNSSTRGHMFVGRPSAPSGQDALCVCFLMSGTYEWWCFNP